MNFFFTYIWFRIAKIYYKWDSDGITASAFLSLSQGLFIGFAILVATKYLDYFHVLYLKIGHLNFSRFQVFIIVSLLAFNYFKYRNRYWRCKEYWAHESKIVRNLKGLLVILFLIIPFILYLNFQL